jgi:DNA-binding XRE family transcriptional regulator
MAINANELIKSLPASRRKKIERRAAVLIEEEMTLQELRKSQDLTQATLAKVMHIAQKQVSELESRTDMHISTVRRQVEAMGGTLQLVVTLPGRAKPIALKGIGDLTVR